LWLIAIGQLAEVLMEHHPPTVGVTHRYRGIATEAHLSSTTRPKPRISANPRCTLISEEPDKPRVERCVQYVRSNFDAGEPFRDINDCRERAEHWCGQTAGMRIYGTTRTYPAVVFSAEEAPALARRYPEAVFDFESAARRAGCCLTEPDIFVTVSLCRLSKG
jgi:hypothetical protein